MRKILIALAFFILIGFALSSRFYKLGSAPDSLIIDEAHYGYIAYSILNTGKDEHGISYPIVFKGFGDYKLPAQVYALVPAIKFFGLNNFSTRFPAALSGVLLVLIVYLLFREWQFSKKAAFFASLITIVSPWSFILSRFAYEANLGLLFFALATLFVFKAAHKKNLIFFILAAVFFAITIYSYVIYKFISVFFVLFFAIYFFFFTNKNKLKAILFTLIFVLLISPFLFGAVASSSNLARFKQVGIISDEQLIREIDENRFFCLKEHSQPLCYGFFNKATVFSGEIFRAFVKSYSPEYLFVKGDAGLTYMNVDKTGLLNLFVLPFYVIGLLVFLQKLLSKNNKNLFLMFLLSGLIIAPLPGVLSGVQKVRISTLFVFILPLLVLAYEFILEKIKFKNLFNLIVIFLAIISFAGYFVNFVSVHSIKKDFFYDSFVKDIFAFTEEYSKNNQVDEVVIQKFFSDPIMYYSYYEKIDPDFYQKNVVLSKLESSGFQHAIALGKYRAAQSEEPNTLACKAYKENKKVLYVDSYWKNSSLHVLKIIKSNFDTLNYAFVIDLNSFGKELNDNKKCN